MTLVARDEELRRTVVTPCLDEPVVSGSSVLYCSTFRLAFGELEAELGGDVRLEGDPPLAERLKRDPATREDLDDASYVAGAGEGEGFVGKMRRELEKRFGKRDDFMLPDRVARGELVAYAYLSKDLELRVPLDADREEGLLFQDTAVACFGSWDEEGSPERSSQILVHDYAGAENFVLEIVTKAADDRLIVARITPASTLHETAERVLDRAGKKPGFFDRALGRTKLGKGETVQIPMLDLDVLRSYRELADRPVVGQDRIIAKALQKIRFRLDEKGAMLRSAGLLMVPRGGSPRRSFICNGPFLVLLARVGCPRPYFAAWVDNPELLMPIG